MKQKQDTTATSRSEKIRKLVERINATGNADFVKRLLDEKRKAIHNPDGTVSTHELGYATDDSGNAVVFPYVQSSGDTLRRYKWPYAYDRAVERGDTLHMSRSDADLFTKGYKPYYPGFKQYAEGGDTNDELPWFQRTIAESAGLDPTQMAGLPEQITAAEEAERKRAVEAEDMRRRAEAHPGWARFADSVLQTAIDPEGMNPFVSRATDALRRGDIRGYNNEVADNAVIYGAAGVGGGVPLLGTVGSIAGANAAAAASASGTLPGTAAALYGNAARGLLMGLPAFEFTDQIPTLFNKPRFTEWGSNLGNVYKEGLNGSQLAEQTAPAVSTIGSLAVSVPVGMGAGMLDAGVLSAFNTAGSAFGKLARLRNPYKMTAEDVADMSSFATKSAQPREVEIPVLEDNMPTAEELAAYERFANAFDTGASEKDALKGIHRYPGGYMLKSLMPGNPIEKQISKQGTVSVNNIRALANKASKIDQIVIAKVLSEDAFSGKKTIDYNDFRSAVQRELIAYRRAAARRYEDYGAGALGLNVQNERVAALPPDVASLIEDSDDSVIAAYFGSGPNARAYLKDANTGENISPRELILRYGDKVMPYISLLPDAPFYETYTLSSPRVPIGNGRHYSPSTLAHVRTYTLPKEPGIRYVMESQSDAAQHGIQAHGQPTTQYLNDVGAMRDFIDGHKRLLAAMKAHPEKYVSGAAEAQEANIAYHEKVLADMLRKVDATTNSQVKYLLGKYEAKNIQELLRLAAEKGEKKLRFPTRETAARVEGYPKEVNYYDKNGKRVLDYLKYEDDIERKIDDLIREKDILESKYLDTAIPFELTNDSFRANSGNEKGTEMMIARLSDKLDICLENQRFYIMYGDQNPYLDAKINTMKQLLGEQTSLFKERYGRGPEVERLIDESHKAEAKLDIVESQLSELYKTPMVLKPGLEAREEYMYEDILAKYRRFPELYKKMFKGAEVRDVTDALGNTWYEVDVPENYLHQEWPFAKGGSLHKNSRLPILNDDLLLNYFAVGGDMSDDIPWYQQSLSKTAGFVPRLLMPLPVPSAVEGSSTDSIPEVVEEAPKYDYDELKRRQYYAESRFNDKAVSRKGARGAYQIMPITKKDYINRTGNDGDLDDYGYNEGIRDYYMNMYLNSDMATKKGQSEYNRIAKSLAAYNWGKGNLINYLNGQKESGVDIYQGTDWIAGLPAQTRNYIKFILDGEDIGGRITNRAYERAKEKLLRKTSAIANAKSIGGAIELPTGKSLIDKYGIDAVRTAMQKLRGAKRYDGSSEDSQQMETPKSKSELRRMAFIEQKREQARLAAHKNSLNREMPAVPIVQYDEYGLPEYGPSCIYTATDNYGKKYRCAGNKEFYSNSNKYGFTKIPLKDVKPGDIVQDNQVHSLIFDSYDPDGNMLFNYSDGGESAWSIRKRVPYFNPGYLQTRPNIIAYRFVGTDEDNDRWSREWLEQDKKNTLLKPIQFTFAEDPFRENQMLGLPVYDIPGR